MQTLPNIAKYPDLRLSLDREMRALHLQKQSCCSGELQALLAKYSKLVQAREQLAYNK